MTNITLYTSTRQCIADNYFLGYEGENKINKLIFKFDDGFRDGLGILNVKRGEEKGYLELEKVGDTYELEVKSALLSKIGEITFQLSINEPDGTAIKYDAFQMTVKDSIDTDTEMPEDYPSWVDMANAKLAEVDEAITNVETAIENANDVSNELLQSKANGEFNGKDGEDGVDGISSEITVKTNTETEYILTIKDVNGSFDTPNLKGKDSEGGIVNETDPLYSADKPKLALKTELPTKTSQLANDSSFATEAFVTNKIAEAELSGGDVDLSGYATKNELNKKADVEDIPTKVSELDNDRGFITDYEETDPTVPSHVKAIKEADITNWNNKQDVLTAGNNITIENGVISANGSGTGGLAELPIATSDTLGGIKVGEGLEITEDGILSALGSGSGGSIGSMVEIGNCNLESTTEFLNAAKTITLSKSIENFDLIAVERYGKNANDTTRYQVEPIIFTTDSIVNANTNETTKTYQSSNGFDISSAKGIITTSFKFPSNTTLTIEALTKNGTAYSEVGLGKVYGIKLGSSGGSSYTETELLSEPVDYAQGGTGGTAIGQDLVLSDDVTNYDEIVIKVIRNQENKYLWYPSEIRVLTSNIVYNNSNDSSNGSGDAFMISTGTTATAYWSLAWFKDSKTMRIYKTQSSVAVNSTDKFRFVSIKGIKY